MILGRVIGEVWATRRDPRLGRSKLLVVRPHGLYDRCSAADIWWRRTTSTPGSATR